MIKQLKNNITYLRVGSSNLLTSTKLRLNKIKTKEFPTKYIDYNVIQELNILNISQEIAYGLRVPIIFSYIPFHRVVLIRTSIEACAKTSSMSDYASKQYITQALYSIFNIKMKVINCNATWSPGEPAIMHSDVEYTTALLLNIFEYRKLYKSYCKLKLSK